MGKHGLFVGMITLDLIYLTSGLTGRNQKIVALDCTVAAGGPATNAAVTFSYLGNQATLLGVLGTHPLKNMILTDLASCGVITKDLDPTQPQAPPVSSIIVTQSTGERAVVSLDAVSRRVEHNNISADILLGIDIVLVDGHQLEIGPMLEVAKVNNIPIVMDGGSWKPGFEKILPYVDYAICSANFYPPDCNSPAQVFTYLTAAGIPHIAITDGEHPIATLSAGRTGLTEVPKILAVDTLGAGDVFHGAFCHYILRENFTQAIAAAAQVAAHSCQFFGTRRWMQDGEQPLKMQ